MPHRLAHTRVFALIFQTPLDRFTDQPAYGWVIAIMSGVLSIIASDILHGILLLYIVAAGADYFLGRAVARRGGIYQPAIAHAGALTKVASVFLILLVRGFEGWATLHHITGVELTQGALSTVLATGLFVMELESIEHHRAALKAKPIPGFSAVIQFMRTLEAKLLPPATPAVPATPPAAAAPQQFNPDAEG